MKEVLVQIIKDEAVTSSLRVAEVFEKRHSDVLESIKNLVAENSVAKFFSNGTYENRGKEYPLQYMNRDGESLKRDYMLTRCLKKQSSGGKGGITMKRIYRLRRLGLLMVIFLIGVLVSGEFPDWVKVVFPGLFVLLLSNYDDARIAMFEKWEE